MRRPRFALSMMLGVMAASMLALGFPPCPNGPAAVGGTANAALICPTSSLAAESHPFRWFERADALPPDQVADSWLSTVRVPNESTCSMQLEACDLSIADEAGDDLAADSDAAASDFVFADDAPTSMESGVDDLAFDAAAEVASIFDAAERDAIARRIAMELCGLSWIEDLGWCSEFIYGLPRAAFARTADATSLVADFRHSTGKADAMRINLREGRPPRQPSASQPAVAVAEEPVKLSAAPEDDIVLAAIVSAGDAYERYYRFQESASDAARLITSLSGNLATGLRQLMELTAAATPESTEEAASPAYEAVEPVADVAETVESDEAPIHTISIIRPSLGELEVEDFELVSEYAERFVYVRVRAPVLAAEIEPVAAVEPSVTNSFELVIDGPDRFLFLRKEGFAAKPAARPARSLAVMLPRPMPAAASIGVDASWLAWDYFRFQVADVIDLPAAAVVDASVDNSLADASRAMEEWDCLAYARKFDSPRDQIRAEEEATDGNDDSIQALIKAQAAAEGVSNAALPAATPADPLDAIAPPPAPLGCHGIDPIGCLSHRSQMRAERWAHSAIWSISRLATVLAGCAEQLRTAVESQNGETVPEAPAGSQAVDHSQSGDCLDPVERTTASQRFLSELYLGL